MAEFLRRAAPVAFVPLVVVVLAGCGGSGSSPHVANLGTSQAGPGVTTTTLPTGNATRLLNQWAACMRSHGDPGQSDPTIDANNDIEISIAPDIQGGYEGYSGEYGTGGPGVYCRSYLTAAQRALGYDPSQKFDEAKALKLSECMRANGISDFPDPTASGLSIRIGGDLDPTNPAFQTASKLCAEQTGEHVPGVGTPPSGLVKLVDAGPPPGDGGTG